jgi:hypothetical protein
MLFRKSRSTFGAYEDVPLLRRLTDLPFTAEAQVRSQSSTCNINGGHGVGTGFCRYFVLHLVNTLPQTLHIHLILLNQKDKWVKHRKLHTIRPFARR